ncbi:hypothetical protein [Clostridium sp. 'White wine YQ']|uniref:hypothetical protein n=1 Tax=Clostridium sp. 'White wine YQ' TaxID=3027474 RepID=UPI0023669E87|nr:hypothetical protein [Clostridium sp. 'White wine YQ']MDD7793010.1 hypothetical protein [Clostridium sp. 'White wine YQ']
MEKTIVLNLKDMELKGDILDVGGENYGVIYNIKKYLDSEVAVDFVDESREIINSNYDTCILFFSLGKINNNKERHKLMSEIYPLIKEDGELYIWDIVKKKNEVFKNKIRVILPEEKTKEFSIKDSNFLKEWSADESKKVLEKYCDILETREWEDIFFIKAKKKGRNTDEDIINSDQLKVHSQQFSGEILKDIYRGLKLSRYYKGIFNK